MRALLVSVFVTLALACGGAVDPGSPDANVTLPDGRVIRVDSGPTTMPPDASHRDAGMPPEGLAARQRALAEALRPGSSPHFLFGMGNDLAADHNNDGAYTLGTTVDIHYAYLVGLSSAGGWVTWNGGGSFPDVLDDAAQRHGVTSMYTYYVLGALFEQGQNPIQDAGTMDTYMQDVRLLATRLGALGRPFVVHHEPDAWGYIQQRVDEAGMTPDTYAVRLHTANFHDCDDLPETVHGFGQCFVRLFRDNAPMVKIGLHASEWASWYDRSDPSADVEGSANRLAAFLRACGADSTDFIATDPLDRDAGFWETHTGGWDGACNASPEAAMCSVNGGGRGTVYLDETDASLPNYTQYLRWVRALATAMQQPVLFWQVPFGVPSEMCGGPDGALHPPSDLPAGCTQRFGPPYRDNHVHYFFSHVNELVAAGAFGAVFGTGAGGQTYITNDGDQFRNAVNGYFASPTALP
jgi:hypothetical protein